MNTRKAWEDLNPLTVRLMIVSIQERVTCHLSMSEPDSRVNISATQDSLNDGRQTRLKLN